MSLKLLLVDDNDLLRDIVADTISAADYEVAHAATGAQALALAAEKDFDVVLLDIDLGGGLDGFEVCRRLVAADAPPVVIFLTGLASDADRAAGMEAGASAFLAKPFSPLDLMEKLREVEGRP